MSGNIRDYSNVAQLVCLANLEVLNADFIERDLPQNERIEMLNRSAIKQMTILSEDERIDALESNTDKLTNKK